METCAEGVLIGFRVPGAAVPGSTFRVLGSGAGCRVLGSAPTTTADSAEILLQTHVGADRAISQAMEAREFHLLEVRSVPSAQEPILNLQQRGFRNDQEALEFGSVVSPESFCRVRTR
jgi:hypothetical protein